MRPNYYREQDDEDQLEFLKEYRSKEGERKERARKRRIIIKEVVKLIIEMIIVMIFLGVTITTGVLIMLSI